MKTRLEKDGGGESGTKKIIKKAAKDPERGWGQLEHKQV